MSKRSLQNSIAPSCILLVACLFTFLCAGLAVAQNLPAGETVWQENVQLDQPLNIPRGSRLLVRPGVEITVASPSAKITISGILAIEGRAKSPVVVTGIEGWQGIHFIEAEKGSVIRHAHFHNGETALSSVATDFEVTDAHFSGWVTAIKLLRESNPLIERNRFEENDMAIDNEMKSVPLIRDNLFKGQHKTAILASHNSRGEIRGNRFEGNEQGIGLLQTYQDRIVDNIFIENRIGLYCNQTKNTPMIKGNRFEKNEVAIVNYAFAYPAIEDNSFIDNKMAVRNDQYGSPRLVYNLFRGNETAIYNYRKSNPVIENNRIEKSGVALYCDYSSYPRVKQNNFSDNRLAVELGIYQSADWEKRSGSKKLMQKEAQARNSRNTMLDRAPETFNDIVDVSGNWWNDKTSTLQQAEKGQNLDLFYDRLDKEWVTYEGFGPESYRIDLVGYRPWLEAPVAAVGPREAQ
ncbi:MAG: hypothetical protein C0615_04625 [Desulfuromonas sp.]|nr:MAG: hypothetical protein C0615_04625 [Desulfuromonas sp.]